MKYSRSVKNVYHLATILFASLYGLWLASLSNALFRDRENYMVYATKPDELLALRGQNPFFFLFEPLFLILNNFFLLLFNNPEFTISIFVFFIAFSVCYFCIRRNNLVLFGVFMLVFLFVQTQSLAMQLVTLRQGLGLAFLLLLVPSIKKKKHLVLLLLLCGLIHTSFFIVAFFYVIYQYIYVNFRWSSNIKMMAFVAVGLAFSLSLFSLMNLVDAKQNYQGFQFSSGGGAFLLWLIVFVYIQLFKKRQGNIKLMYDLAFIGLVIYLTGYFFTPISGRIIGTFIPFIMIVLLNKATFRDVSFLFILLIVNALLYVRGAFEGFLLVPLEIFHENLLLII